MSQANYEPATDQPSYCSSFRARACPGRPLIFFCNTLYSLGMQQKTVTFRAPGDKIKALDSLAAVQQRDRSFVLNEAVDQYLSLNEYHIALIKEGIRQADAGKLIPHDEVRRRLMKLEPARKPKKKTK